MSLGDKVQKVGIGLAENAVDSMSQVKYSMIR